MPLVVMCGIPNSGKSTKALKIKEYIEKEHKKNACIVSEMTELKKAGYQKNACYVDSQKEKHIRGVLKSEVMRLLDKQDVVILDSGNYIKGFRYELYCASKAVKTTQCTVFCIANIATARARAPAGEEPYELEVFDALVGRFEEPMSHNRWDQPLVMWGEEEEEGREAEALTEVYGALFQRAPPPPNLSTQNAPLTATTFLQRVDKQTREVCERAASGLVPGLPATPPPAPAQLARLRRQFLTYTKQMLSAVDPDTISPLFVQYLMTNLNE